MKGLALDEIAGLLGAELRGEGSVLITGASGLEDAVSGDLSYIVEPKFLSDAAKSKASVFLVKEFFDDLSRPQIKVDDPQLAFAGMLERLRPRPSYPKGISPQAYVDPQADLAGDVCVMPNAYISAGVSIGVGSTVGAGVFIGQDTRLGEGCLIHPNVTVMDGVTIGDRVIIHAGTVIGSDGYGYLQRGGRHVKIPQVGGVIVGDDVEIGANCTIDRASTGNTVIGEGSKLDNLVHIAHNVVIGKGALLTAQIGIAGSSKLGDYVVMAGQSGVIDHLEIADNVVLAAKSSALSDIKEGGMYGGTPAIPIRNWLKASKALERLPELIKTVRALKKRLDDKENNNEGEGK